MNDQIPQEEPLLGQSFEWYNKNNPITNTAHNITPWFFAWVLGCNHL